MQVLKTNMYEKSKLIFKLMFCLFMPFLFFNAFLAFSNSPYRFYDDEYS